MSALRPGGRAPGRARPRGRVAGARRAVWGLGCRPTPSRRADARRSGTAQGRRRAGGGGRRRASAGASGQRGERGRVNRRFPVNWSADALAGSSQQAKNVRRWRATHTRFQQRHGVHTHEVRTQATHTTNKSIKLSSRLSLAIDLTPESHNIKVRQLSTLPSPHAHSFYRHASLAEMSSSSNFLSTAACATPHTQPCQRLLYNNVGV